MKELTQSDKEWLDKNIGEKEMKQYPKFQLSKFLAGGRDYQVVIRTDDAKELVEAMKQIKPLVEGIEGGTTKPKKDVTDQLEGRTCRNCHRAKMVKNPKTGKFFCEDKCWLK